VLLQVRVKAGWRLRGGGDESSRAASTGPTSGAFGIWGRVEVQGGVGVAVGWGSDWSARAAATGLTSGKPGGGG
jgi:hypothetical protein